MFRREPLEASFRALKRQAELDVILSNLPRPYNHRRFIRQLKDQEDIGAGNRRKVRKTPETAHNFISSFTEISPDYEEIKGKYKEGIMVFCTLNCLGKKEEPELEHKSEIEKTLHYLAREKKVDVFFLQEAPSENGQLSWLDIPGYKQFCFYEPENGNMNPRGAVAILIREEKILSPDLLLKGLLREHPNAHEVDRPLKKGAKNKGVIIVGGSVNIPAVDENGEIIDTIPTEFLFVSAHYSVFPPPPFGRRYQASNLNHLIEQHGSGRKKYVGIDTNAYLFPERRFILGPKLKGLIDYFHGIRTATVFSYENPQVRRFFEKFLRIKHVEFFRRNHDTIYGGGNPAVTAQEIKKEVISVPGSDHSAVVLEVLHTIREEKNQ